MSATAIEYAARMLCVPASEIPPRIVERIEHVSELVRNAKPHSDGIESSQIVAMIIADWADKVATEKARSIHEVMDDLSGATEHPTPTGESQ